MKHTEIITSQIFSFSTKEKTKQKERKQVKKSPGANYTNNKFFLKVSRLASSRRQTAQERKKERKRIALWCATMHL